MRPRYRPIRRLAAGGMAEVVLAHEDRGDGIERMVVLKRALPHLRGEDEFVAMFASEARLAMQLQHPNIVQVLDAGTEDGVPYLAMELLDGGDVRDLIVRARAAGERLDPAVACAIAAAAARGLHYAHTRRDPAGRPLEVVHRDVSPHNLFATRDGCVKVLDFGIAKSVARLAITREGEVRGKVLYMAPEQISGAALDGRADLFALGTVLWEMLVGKRLWQRDSEAAIVRAVLEQPAPPPSERVPGLPEELDRVVLAMLAKFRSSRPASCQIVAQELDAIVHALGCTSPQGAIAEAVARYCPPRALETSRSPSLELPDAVRLPAPSTTATAPAVTTAPPSEPASSSRSPRRSTVLVAGVAALGLVALAGAVATTYGHPRADSPPPPPPTVHLRVLRAPAGALVAIDGRAVSTDSVQPAGPAPRHIEVRDAQGAVLLDVVRPLEHDLELALATAPAPVAPAIVAPPAPTPAPAPAPAPPPVHHAHPRAVLGARGINEYPH